LDGSKAAPNQARAFFARFLGSVFFMPIKDLHDHDRTVTRRMGPFARFSGLVEFRTGQGRHVAGR
jgi:hypothetical protein